MTIEQSHPVAQYALHEKGAGRITGVIVRDPATGRLVSNLSLSNGYQLEPALMDLPTARQLADQLKDEQYAHWEPIPSHAQCATCGRNIPVNALDYLYGSSHAARVICRRSEGGCGHEFADSDTQLALSRRSSAQS